MKNKDKITNVSVTIITVLIILLTWTVVSLAVGSKYILPSVYETAIETIKLFAVGEFYLAFLFTLIRSIIAFILSFLLAFAFSVFAYKSKKADTVVTLLTGIMRALPTVAVILLLLIWTNSQIAPIIVTSLVVLPTLKTEITNSINAIDKDVLEMCKVFEVDKKSVYKKVIIPQLSPTVLLSIGAGLSLNVKLMVAAEVLASTKNSIGNMLNFANYNLLVSRMLALVVVSVITCLIVEKVFKSLSKKAGKWL